MSSVTDGHCFKMKSRDWLISVFICFGFHIGLKERRGEERRGEERRGEERRGEERRGEERRGEERRGEESSAGYSIYLEVPKENSNCQKL